MLQVPLAWKITDDPENSREAAIRIPKTVRRRSIERKGIAFAQLGLSSADQQDKLTFEDQTGFFGGGA